MQLPAIAELLPAHHPGSMHWRLLLFLLLSPVCRAADEAPKSAEQWVEELSAAYAKLESCLATYRCEGKDYHLEAILGLDKPSGIVALQVNAENRGQKFAARQWKTRDGDFFVDHEDRLAKIAGIRDEIQSLVALRKAVDRRLTDLPFTFEFHVAPLFVLEERSINLGIHLGNKQKPAWTDIVENSAIISFDDKSVTFATPKNGALTISRDNGIITRQAIAVDVGEVRALELAKLELNPGDKAVEAIYASWKTLGARQAGAGALTMETRKQMFADIVSMVETGKASLEKLEEVLGDQEDALRQFTAACISDTMGAGADPELNLPFVKIKEFFHQRWKESPAGAGGTEKDFETYLAKPDLRLSVRKQVSGALMKNDDARRGIVYELFGRRESDEPTWKNEAGEAAQQLIDNAVTKAYFEALCDRKMAAMWGEREDLE